MFQINDDLSIYVTRGDRVFFTVTAVDNGKPYKFQPGDVVRLKVYGKKDAENVVLQKDFPVLTVTEKVDIYLTEEETRIGGVISKPTDYWYEVELNPFDHPQTIIGYDEDGAKVFKLFPEGDELPEYVPDPEEIPIVDSALDLASSRPIQNQAVARAFRNLEDGYERVYSAVAEKFVTPQMFGAIADGEADDTDAMHDAIAYANEKDTEIVIPSGVYVVNDLVVSNVENVKIKGNNATITSVTSPVLAFGAGCKNVDISGVIFTTNGEVGTDNKGIGTVGNANVNGVHIHDCVFKNLTCGVVFDTTYQGYIKNITVENCRFTDIYGEDTGSGYGVDVSNSNADDLSNIKIIGNVFDNCQRHSIYVSGGHGFAVKNNHVMNHRKGLSTGAVRAAINVARSKDVLIEGNTVESCNNSALCLTSDTETGTGCENITVRDNTFKECVLAPVYVGYITGSSLPIRNVEICGNNIYGQIQVVEGFNVFVHHNKIIRNASVFLIVLGGGKEGVYDTDNMVVSDNMIYNASGVTQPVVRLNSGACTKQINILVKDNAASNFNASFLSGQSNVTNDCITVAQANAEGLVFESGHMLRPYA